MTEDQFQKKVLGKLTRLEEGQVKLEKGQARLEEGQIKLEKIQDSILCNVADFREEFASTDFVSRAELNQAFQHISSLTRRVEKLERASSR